VEDIMVKKEKERAEISIATPCDSQWAKRKWEDEPQPDDPRTPFQHDKDRILHSTAFRRLQYKTQVYVVHEGDLYRTRLTHSLEVAQIARGLAKLLKADIDLVEAISLAHDLGHAPFGHIGGEKLRELLEPYGIPFDHNIQSYRIVSYLEERYSGFKGLNLTDATLEGILRHHTPFDSEEDIKSAVPTETEDEVSKYFDSSPQPSAETQIVSIADIIAYAAHDIEDALAVGLISWDTFKDQIQKENIDFILDIIANELEQKMDEYKRFNAQATDEVLQKIKLRTLSRMIIEYLIRNVYKQTKSNIEKIDAYQEATWMKIRGNKSPVVAFPSDLERQTDSLVNTVLFKNVYREPRVMVMMQKAKKIIDTLFQSFMDEPQALPKITQSRLAEYFAMTERMKKSRVSRHKLATVVGDYISGMTDKYAMDMYQLLTQAYEKAL